MGSIQLQYDPVRGWVGPSVYASQLPALFDGNNTEAGGVVALGDGTSSNITWNYFYVLPPNIPSGSIPIQIRSSWFVEVIGGSGSIGQLTIQMHAGTQGGGQVDLAFGNASPVAYPVNFVLAPSWTYGDLYFGMLANAAIGVTEIFALLYYAEPPSAHFTLPATNGAVINDTVRPSLQWTYSAGAEGGPQSTYRLMVYTQAQTQAAGFVAGTTAAIWDSHDVHSSVASVTVPINLANNTTYVAYLAVAQTVSGTIHWATGYATRTFTVSIPAAAVPARPTVTATADSTNARAIVTVTQSGTPAWDHVVVQKSLDNGSTWIGVRSGDVDVAPGDTLTISDYESPNGQPAVYRAQAQRTATTGGIDQITVSQFSPSSGAVAWRSDSVWLKSPLFPAFNTTVRLGQFGTFTRRIARGVFDIAGRSKPVVVSDVRHGLEGQLTIAVRSIDELDDIRFMSDLSTTVLLQTPAAYNFGSKYLALGDEHEDRINIVASNAFRWVQFDFVEVDSPVGDALATTTTPGKPPQAGSVATWADVVTLNIDWITLIAQYPTWRDLYGFTVFSYSDLVVAQASWATTVVAYATWNALLGVITPPTPITGYLLDESGNFLTDESGNRLTAP
jgi:hypothetical protein